MDTFLVENNNYAHKYLKVHGNIFYGLLILIILLQIGFLTGLILIYQSPKIQEIIDNSQGLIDLIELTPQIKRLMIKLNHILP